MSLQNRYEINPEIVWNNELKGRVLVIDIQKEEQFWLSGYDAVMWRSIWQGFSPLIWKPQVEESGCDPIEILNGWIKTGLINEVHS